MFTVGIAGGSGSGKTTFSKRVLARIPDGVGAVLKLDSYYLPELPSHLVEDGKGNFDHPDAFDWDLINHHIDVLKAGGVIEQPVYDFVTSTRTDETIQVGPLSVVLVEGIFVLSNEQMRDRLDLAVYLQVDADIRFIRRLNRDMRQRGRSLDSIVSQYYDTVRPMHRDFIEPTRQYADVIIGEETETGAKVLAARVEQIYREDSSLERS